MTNKMINNGDDPFNISYIGVRDDILNLIPSDVKKVLDVGCSIGKLGEQIKSRYSAEVVGIELDKKMGEVALVKLDKVIIGDIELLELDSILEVKYFDCIILADILEHLKNPWIVLKKIIKYLSDEGIIILSIPNVRHYSTIIELLVKSNWPYRDRGIHDKSHLRFFTLKNIRELLNYANLTATHIERNYRIIEKPFYAVNRFSKYLTLFIFKDLLTFQYLIIAKKVEK
ncbi:class I SAM-dependent methyltransferase [Pelotomaculum propionicicum]|uniref:class I SAM-dependent methyltransferase n=1 Tax=Pelotomaculum propionicicum TaxID=258475 RepID=UPI003B7C15B1